MERESEDRHLVLEPRRQRLPGVDEEERAVGVEDFEVELFPVTPGSFVVLPGPAIVLGQRRQDERVELLDRRVVEGETWGRETGL